MTENNFNSEKWKLIFDEGGPRNFYPHSYVVSWYFKSVHKSISRNQTIRVLDIGCGTSPDLYLFSNLGYEYHGLDITNKCFKDIIKTARKRNLNLDTVFLKEFMPPHLPYNDESFDIVIGLESIHFNHSSELMGGAINEIFRVMKSNGNFFFSTIDHNHYFVKTEHSRFLSKTSLEIEKGFPIKNRWYLKYYVFENVKEITSYFSNFSKVEVGRYLLDTNDGQPDSYYLIFGEK